LTEAVDQHMKQARCLSRAPLTWYFVAMVLIVPVSSMHSASTTTEARMAAAAVTAAVPTA
jgi:hypothetical protein